MSYAAFPTRAVARFIAANAARVAGKTADQFGRGVDIEVRNHQGPRLGVSRQDFCRACRVVKAHRRHAARHRRSPRHLAADPDAKT